MRGLKKVLSGHSGGITCLVVCPAFSVLVSGSEDGTFVVWDLNHLTYTRSVSPGGRGQASEEFKAGQESPHPVTTLAISETMGEIASVVQTGEFLSHKPKILPIKCEASCLIQVSFFFFFFFKCELYVLVKQKVFTCLLLYFYFAFFIFIFVLRLFSNCYLCFSCCTVDITIVI